MRAFAVFIFSLCASVAHAMPVGFNGSWMTMFDVSEEVQEASVGYSFTKNDAVSIGALRWDKDGRRRDIVDAHYSRRIYRWNLPNAQANVYAQAGIGSGRASEFSGRSAVFQLGTQLDYETTRVYAAYKGHRYIASDFNHTQHAVLGGFSFYEVDYDQWQPWLILEAKRISKWSKETEFTLMARFIHRNYFVEIGANQEGKPRATLMVIWF